VTKKPLIATNPYLKNPATRQKLFLISALTSAGVEGVRISDKFISYKNCAGDKVSFHKTAKSAKSK